MSQGEPPRWHSTELTDQRSVFDRRVDAFEDYKVVRACCVDDLQDYVGAAIRRGFKCQGGVVVDWKRIGSVEYLQAMVKG